ncbi:EamA family transporter [Thalassotalea euphylliae]|uniref:EamA family transporter n=1 Tax=Thalassotalea euphylliae TaxID=1655234 RepID=A0A3E0TW84_9GAMM|nr:EamA family transporter [Thalassotalea euphylliae]REL28714.1 EamA family transporter [Thalassotalea euphylliae]
MKALIFVSVLWALSFGLIKGELTGIAPSVVAALRLLICALVFLPFMRFKADNKFNLQLLVLGALQFGVMYWAYITSYQYLPGYLVAVFTIFTPFYVFFIDGLLSRRISLQPLAPIALSVVGAGIIVFKAPESANWLTGFVILQSANLAFAIGQVGYKHLSEHHLSQREKPLHTSNMAVMYTGAAIFMMVIVLFEQSYVDVPAITPRQWLVLLYLGIIASGVGFALWNYGAKQVDAPTLAIMNNAYIPFAVIFALTLFGERADMVRLLAGTGLILMSAYWLTKVQHAHKHQEQRVNEPS